MKTWFNEKEPYEQKVIIAVGVLVIISLIYLLIWTPISDSYRQKSSRVTAQKNLLSWMKRTGQQIVDLRGNKSAQQRGSSGPLLSTVDRTIKSSGLSLTMKRLEPQGSDKVQIWFNNTNFDRLINWLGQIDRQYRIHIFSINIEAQAKSGQVNARVILTKGS